MMTKTEIIAELRRSATEDADPYKSCHISAWLVALDFGRSMRGSQKNNVRTFYLLVAEALEHDQ